MPPLASTKMRENANTQNPSSTPSTDREGTDDEQYTTHDDSSNREEDSSDEEGGDSTEDEANSEYGGRYLRPWRHKIWTRRLEYWDNKRWLTLRQNVEQLENRLCTSELKNNKYYQQWLRGCQSENLPDDGKGIPPDRVEPTTGSPNVASTSLPSMAVAAMDMTVQDAVLPTRATIKVPANLLEKNA